MLYKKWFFVENIFPIMIDWTPLATSYGGKFDLTHHPSGNRERSCFPFAFCTVPFAICTVPFAICTVPFAICMVLDRADGEGDRINFPQKIIFYPIMKINQWGQYSWLTFLSKDTLWCWYTLLRFHDSSEKKIYSGLRQKNPYYFQMPSSTPAPG